MRGALYYDAGKFAQAKRDFEKVDAHPDLRFEPQKFSYLYTALGLMTTDSEPQNSLRYFKQAAEWKPEPAAFENVAIAAKKLRDFETAERYYQKVPRDFKPPSHYLNLSSLYFESQQFDKGAAIMTEAIDAGCNDILCYKMRCYFRIESGDFSGANEDFEQASAILTQLPEAMPDPDLENMGMRLLLRR
jgi:tetratricopeptide (TPR) repeat protein